MCTNGNTPRGHCQESSFYLDFVQKKALHPSIQSSVSRNLRRFTNNREILWNAQTLMERTSSIWRANKRLESSQNLKPVKEHETESITFSNTDTCFQTCK